jgi:hypothetical protein
MTIVFRADEMYAFPAQIGLSIVDKGGARAQLLVDEARVMGCDREYVQEDDYNTWYETPFKGNSPERHAKLAMLSDLWWQNVMPQHYDVYEAEEISDGAGEWMQTI